MKSEISHHSRDIVAAEEDAVWRRTFPFILPLGFICSNDSSLYKTVYCVFHSFLSQAGNYFITSYWICKLWPKKQHQGTYNKLSKWLQLCYDQQSGIWAFNKMQTSCVFSSSPCRTSRTPSTCLPWADSKTTLSSSGRPSLPSRGSEWYVADRS